MTSSVTSSALVPLAFALVELDPGHTDQGLMGIKRTQDEGGRIRKATVPPFDRPPGSFLEASDEGLFMLAVGSQGQSTLEPSVIDRAFADRQSR
jgi:hypothetical protein